MEQVQEFTRRYNHPQTNPASKPLRQDRGLIESLIRNHPFVEGNKRIAITAAGLLLRRTGFRFDAAQEELYAFRGDGREAGQLAAREWLAARSRRI